jgi:hypothetical protein
LSTPLRPLSGKIFLSGFCGSFSMGCIIVRTGFESSYRLEV